MKNIKTFDTYNEGLFSEEGDNFAKQIINILKKENIKINKTSFEDIYSFKIDNIEYEIIYNPTNKFINHIIYEFLYDTFLIIKEPTEEVSIKVSNKYFNKINQLYKKQTNHEKQIELQSKKKEQQKKIQSLPDLSDIGRAAKRYNL